MTSVCVSLPLMQASVGAQFGLVRQISGPLCRISDHMGLMFRRTSLPTTKLVFRQTSLLTTSSVSVIDCNTCWSAAMTASSAHYTSSGVQNTRSKMVPTCSNCSESDFCFSSSFSPVKKPYNFHQLQSPSGSDLNSSPIVGNYADGCTLVS